MGWDRMGWERGEGAGAEGYSKTEEVELRLIQCEICEEGALTKMCLCMRYVPAKAFSAWREVAGVVLRRGNVVVFPVLRKINRVSRPLDFYATWALLYKVL